MCLTERSPEGGSQGQGGSGSGSGSDFRADESSNDNTFSDLPDLVKSRALNK